MPVRNGGHAGDSEAIAIVGMGGVFPGSTSLEEFWRLVEAGRDSCREVPPGRWQLDPDKIRSNVAGAPDGVLSTRGCYVEGFEPDVSAIRLPEDLAATLDPAFHFLITAGHAAFAQAETRTLNRSKVGVIIGSIALPTAGSSALCDAVLEPLYESNLFGRAGAKPSLTGNPFNRYVTGLPAGLLARSLGLGGTSYGLDAACASSLYAIKQACDELTERRADAMLAGGLSRPDSLYTQMGFSQLRALSPSGRCSPFDRKGDGLIVGEGAGMLVLKRLADALRDGDRILALIRGSGISNDVEGNLLSPSSEGQLRALHAAYAKAGWTPDMVDLIECHATGTPVGDAVEFASLAQLWRDATWREGQCVLSAVKSNIGHLLTAAGSAGLIKTLLAMQHETLPPVANFTTPSAKVSLAGSPFAVLSESRPWLRRAEGVPRRAAINGFGFGGINAHLLIEEWLPAVHAKTRAAPVRPPKVQTPPEPIAVVGMAVRVGHWQDLTAFARHVLDSESTVKAVPRTNWRGLDEAAFSATWGGATVAGTAGLPGMLPGYFLDDLAVPIDRFHIPPRELAEMLPQQLLMLDVAKSALEDARNPQVAGARSGVFIGLGLDLRTTDFHFRWTAKQQGEAWARRAGIASMDTAAWISAACEGAGQPLTADRTLGALGGIVASRIAREFHIGGPSHAICSEDTSGLRALEVAARALWRGELDIALSGAVDLGGDLRAMLATNALHAYSQEGRAKPFDQAADGTVPGEGAACVVLKRLSDAQRDGDRVYALIRGVGTTQGDAVGLGGLDTTAADVAVGMATAYTSALSGAYAEAGVAPATVQLVEAHGSATETEDAAEAVALKGFFGSDDGKPGGNRGRPLALGLTSAKADVGHTGAASGLVSLIKASLCLHHEVLPGLRNMQVARSELSSASQLVLPRGVRPWIRNRVDGPRRAGVSAMGMEGGCIHVVLDAAEPMLAGSNAMRYRPPVSEALFTLSAPHAEALAEALVALEHLVHAGIDAPVEQLARQWWRLHGDEMRGPHRVALLARDGRQLLRLIRQAAAGKPADVPPGSQDYERVFHQPARSGAAAADHPGRVAFVYPGTGNQFDNMGLALARQWPHVLRAQDGENERLASQMCVDQFWRGPLSPELLSDHRALISGQVTFGTLVTDLAASFGLKPSAAIGYSLGESTALFAMRAWRQRDAMLERLRRSSLFAHDLVGHADVLRGIWKLPSSQPVEWVAGVVDRSVEAVRAAIGKRQRVHVLIVNTADECVIGGDRAVVEALVAALGCHWFGLQGVGTVHCALARPVRKAYRELHHFDTQPRPDVEFYSCAWGRAYEPDRESAADAIEAQALDTIDFPRVIRAAYAAGVQTFVEIGPGSSCTRMIGKILKDRPHFAKSLAASGSAPVTQFLRTIGQMYAANVPISLQAEYGDDEAARWGRDVALVDAQQGGARQVVVSITGTALRGPAMPPIEDMKPSATPHPVVAPKPTLSAAPTAASLAAPPGNTTWELARPSTASVAVAQVQTERYAHPAMAATLAAERAAFEAHQVFLRFSTVTAQVLAQAVAAQVGLLEAAERGGVVVARRGHMASDSVGAMALPVLPTAAPAAIAPAVTPVPPPVPPSVTRAEAASWAALQAPGDGVPRALDRAACLEFGRGLVGRVLGPRFAAADALPTRVRLPDEPLMLVDRILSIEGEPLSMSHGRVVTEHDIHPGAWYLDCDRIPTCIAVEAGQADLFLSGFLGIDFQTLGHSVYRLLDAKVCFHQGLPGPGEVIHYDIRIDHFFRQSETWLFKFNFLATVNGEPLLTMTDGCAGFFSAKELAAGKGVVRTALDLKPMPGKRATDWQDLVPLGVEAYSEAQLDALRKGDLVACFGEAFAGLPVKQPVTLPDGRMRLVHRIVHLDPAGGRFGLGQVRGEADIHPDDWFLTCHFVDGQVMPGTLMFECCLHTLRVHLLRLGWVAEAGQVVLEPVPGVVSQLKCRGQVLATTRTVTYEVSIKEIGFGPEPYVIADALMYADGKAIVEITNMSLRFAGVTRASMVSLWAARSAALIAGAGGKKPALVSYEKILAFATGNPSEAFGEPYRIFDSGRVIARLPGPPFQFMDRVTEIRAEPWKILAGGEVESQYDVPPDAWYFADNQQGDMPFSVLLEIALQPCGWLAGYMGSALTSDVDVSFRNLGGTATQFATVMPDCGTLTVRVKLTRASSSAGMIIQFFDYAVHAGSTLVYRGDTYFGFFPKSALEKQEGLKDAKRYALSAAEMARATALAFPASMAFPQERLHLLDDITAWIPDGGPKALGFIRAIRRVRPDEWFFKAHFYQDPVVPGSLGLESFLSLLKFIAVERWGAPAAGRLEAVAVDQPHQWTYRGQVVPKDHEVTVEAMVTEVDDARHLLRADGYLCVDGRVIYAMQNFTLCRRDA